MFEVYRKGIAYVLHAMFIDVSSVDESSIWKVTE